jgi:Protein of unknown function (DUF1416)
MHWSWWLLFACAAASAASCAPVISAARHTVAGKVTLGPQCGGPLREGQNCEVDYEAVEVRLLDAQGATVSSARTDTQGRFSLAAAAGNYTVRVVSPKVVRCPEQPVALPAKGAVTLALACDSGRR